MGAAACGVAGKALAMHMPKVLQAFHYLCRSAWCGPAALEFPGDTSQLHAKAVKNCLLLCGSAWPGRCIICWFMESPRRQNWQGGAESSTAVQVSLARALQHVVYPLWLVIFTVLVLIPVAVVRVYNLGLGIISGLVFGIVVLLGESLWPAHTLWRMVRSFEDSAIASAAEVCPACLP